MSGDAPAIRCQRLVKRYGELVAVNGIDLEIERGKCFGLLGPNGAGKTTTVEMLEGLHAPTSGTIELFGLQWGKGQDQELRERIGVQLQNTELGDKLHVDEVLRLFRSFYRRGRDPESLLDLIDLRDSRHQHFSRLSGGQKQRVALATALAGSPDLLFLDEPTTGLDPRARKSLWKIVEAFRAEGGSVLLTTHYMEEAESLCDEIAIMDHGKLIAQGTPRSLVDGLGDVQFLEFELLHELDERQIGAVGGVLDVQRDGARYRVRLGRSLSALSALLAELERQNVVPIGLSTHQATLDDVFLQLTGRGLQEPNQPVGALPQTSAS
jgi:ABC-2 type transport system ATP-binding protein